jgi:hypothetical protein
MNLLLMIMVFALGVALAKQVVKIGLKVMSFSMNLAFGALCLLIFLGVSMFVIPIVHSLIA